MHGCVPSCDQLLAMPWTVALQAPLSMEFSRQEYCSGLRFPSSGDLPDPGTEPVSPALAGGFFTTEPPGKPMLLLSSLIRKTQTLTVYPFASAGDMRDMCSLPGSGKSPGERNGNPLPHSCLENPMDRGGWWATVRSVAKSQTQLKR